MRRGPGWVCIMVLSGDGEARMDGVGSTALQLATYNCFQGGGAAGVIALLAGWDGADLVLGGDFNVVVGRRGPGEPVRMSRAEVAILDRLEQDLDLLACWQAAHPGVPLARTLRWRHRADSLPYHCDGLFVP